MVDEENIHKGKIIAFHGTWMSGLATLVIEDYDRGVVEVPCENAPTVRALDSAFGGVISGGHTVNNKAIQGKEIYYATDEIGILAGFTPVDKEESDIGMEVKL